MVEERRGLIVNISFWAAQKYVANVGYGVAKTATDKMTEDMSHELREHDVAVVSLYPGLVRTEKVMEAAAYLDLSNSESPQFIGRAVAALGADPEIMSKSGWREVYTKHSKTFVRVGELQSDRSWAEPVMETLESAARERGCRYSHLDTFSFQARPFYEGLGYEVFATLDDYPPGHQRFFMKKALI